MMRSDDDHEQRAMRPAPPEAVGGYRLARTIGRGAFGTVYEGFDATTGVRVAVKIFDLAPNGRPWELDAIHRSTSYVHPNLVHVFEVGRTKSGQSYIVTEFVSGGSLNEVVQSDGPFTGRRAAELGAAVADALVAIHSRGVIHTDISPNNILLTSFGKPVLIDFAQAQPVASYVGSGPAARTLTFSAPEWLTGGEISTAADVFALGATLYFALTGRPPFPIGREGVLAGALGLIQDPVPLLKFAGPAGSLGDLIASMLAKDPRDRPSTEEVARELRILEASLSDGDSALDPALLGTALVRYRDVVIQLDEDQGITVGRSPSCDLRLSEFDAELPRVALRIHSRVGRIVLENPATTRVIFVRTSDARNIALRSGEQISLTSPRIRALIPGAAVTYEVEVYTDTSGSTSIPPPHDSMGTAPGHLRFTDSERRLLAAYCEPLLLGELAPASHAAAAAQLGISSLTARNRMTRLVEKATSSLGSASLTAENGKDDLCRLAVTTGIVGTEDLSSLYQWRTRKHEMTPAESSTRSRLPTESRSPIVRDESGRPVLNQQILETLGSDAIEAITRVFEDFRALSDTAFSRTFAQLIEARVWNDERIFVEALTFVFHLEFLARRELLSLWRDSFGPEWTTQVERYYSRSAKAPSSTPYAQMSLNQLLLVARGMAVDVKRYAEQMDESFGAAWFRRMTDLLPLRNKMAHGLFYGKHGDLSEHWEADVRVACAVGDTYHKLVSNSDARLN